MKLSQTYRIFFPKNHLTRENLMFVPSDNMQILPVSDENINDGLIYSFGGLADESSNPFFNFIRFTKIPDDLGITSVKSLTSGVHIRRFDDLDYCVFYQHDEDGIPTFMDGNVNSSYHLPERPSDTEMDEIEPILETKVRLYPVNGLRDEKEWDIMNQVGGTPIWVQGEDIPSCPITRQPMQFLLSFDCLCIPARDGNGGFYSEGVFYVFWSDSARVSAVLYQQT